MTITLAALAFIQASAAVAIASPGASHMETQVGDGTGAHKQPTLFAFLRTEAAAVIETLEKPWDKTVVHKKKAGNGYLKGSPLYEKQEALEKKEKEEETSYQKWLTFNEHMNKGELKGAWQSLSWWMIGEVFISQLVYVLLVLVVAYFWKKGRNSPALSEQIMDTKTATSTWAYGLFECKGATSEDLPICAMACCCPLIRWSDTLSNPKVATSQSKEPSTGVSFWQALGLALVLVFFSPFTGGLTTFVLLGIMIYYRQRLRQIFTHSPGTAGSFCYDFFALWCCNCCALVQEAREVEKVQKPARQ